MKIKTLVTRAEAAEILGCSARKVSALLKAGRLRADPETGDIYGKDLANIAPDGSTYDAARFTAKPPADLELSFLPDGSTAFTIRGTLMAVNKFGIFIRRDGMPDLNRRGTPEEILQTLKNFLLTGEIPA